MPRVEPLRRAIAIALLLLGTGCFQPRFALRYVAGANPEALFLVETEARAVALTIDDGPHPEVTPRILDELAEHGAHATFFLIASRIEGNEALVERIVREGHEIGNHMMRDRASADLSVEAFRRAIGEAHATLTRFADVRWFRPGDGWWTDWMLEELEPFGYELCLASVYPLDAWVRSADFASWHVLHHVYPGAIVVLHEGSLERERSVAVLDEVLPELTRRGYAVTTVSRLVALAGTAATGPQPARPARARITAVWPK